MRLGRMFGIEVKLHWSLLVLVALLTYSLSTGYFGYYNRGHSHVNLVASIIASLSLIGSVLVHELAHVLVGRKFGMSFSGITLFILGGMAKMDRQLETAKSEFWMALAGPVASLIVGVLSFVLASLSGALSGGSVVELLFAYLGIINVVLGVFNMIPILFPLDGSRVLRAAIWWITGSFRKATLIATFIGKIGAGILIGMGALMIAGVSVPVFGTGVASGLINIFIGFFLLGAIKAELNRLNS